MWVTTDCFFSERIQREATLSSFLCFQGQHNFNTWRAVAVDILLCRARCKTVELKDIICMQMRFRNSQGPERSVDGRLSANSLRWGEEHRPGEAGYMLNRSCDSAFDGRHATGVAVLRTARQGAGGPVRNRSLPMSRSGRKFKNWKTRSRTVRNT